jgi:hypothetical protein
MKKLKLTVVMILLSGFVFGQITFQKTYGGANNDIGYSIQQTADSGYIIAGSTLSFGAGGKDVYLIKTNADGNVQWNKAYGGANDDWAQSVIQTSDSGFIVAGTTLSFGVGSSDTYVIKTNSLGDTIWIKTSGGVSNDSCFAVQEILGSGYVIFGSTNTMGFDGTPMLEMNINYNGSAGQVVTTGTTNSISYNIARSGIFIFPYSYFLGYTNRSGNEDLEFGYVNSLNSSLSNFICMGGPGIDRGYCLKATNDGGFIIAGLTTSFGAGSEDVYLIKYPSLWAKAYGGPGTDIGNSVQQTYDGGFIIAGSTTSFGAGNSDVLLLKTDSIGNIIWVKTYGGSGNDYGYSVLQTADSGFAIVGSTESFGAGSSDIYFIKTDALGNSNCNFTNVTCDSVSTPPSLAFYSYLVAHNSGGQTFTATTITQGGIQQDTICSVGIDELSLKNNNIVVFPNPTTDKLTITTNTNSLSEIILYDIASRKLLQQKFTGSVTLNTAQLARGIYIYEVRSKEGVEKGKVVKE